MASNGTPVALPRITDYLQWHAARTPDREAVICGELRLPYARLAVEVDVVSKALLASGIVKGDRICTLAPPGAEFWTLFLAAASIGAIWVGLNPRYTLDEYRYVIKDCEPSLLFTRTRIGERDYTDDIASLQAEVPSLRECIVLGANPLVPGSIELCAFHGRAAQISWAELEHARARVTPDDPALIVYTSGSTGRPKGALLPHRGLVRCSLVQLRMWPLDPVRIVNFLPINHIGCVGDISCYALVAGGTIVFLEKFDPEASLAAMSKERCTLWGGVPTSLLMTLEHPSFDRHDLSSIQLIAWSGAAAPLELAKRLHAVCPYLANAYGLTESVGSVTFAGPTEDFDLLTQTIGKPAPGYEVKVVDAQDVQTSETECGEIVIRGDFIMLGYWRRPLESSQAIDAQGWLHTGDVGVRRADGAIRLVGRLHDAFKSGGYNIYPREIEQVLERCSGVALAAVVGVSDSVYGEVGCAYVVPRADARVEAATLEVHCRASLANYKVPKRFVLIEQLPMLPIGKVDKQQLRALAAKAAASSE